MIKRLIWFTGGIVAGALGMGAAKKKVKTVAGELAPVQVAKRAGESVRDRGRSVSDAVREGRIAMRAKERELRARLDGRASTLADELSDVDAVLVDGRPVEPGQVIVLKQVRADANRSRRRA
ncbi:MAG: hypothetical protein WCP59_07330 [Actinomycetota bacterium]